MSEDGKISKLGSAGWGGLRDPPGGRPRGVVEALRRGEVAAIKALRRRIPKDAEPEDVELADEARDTLVAVMLGDTHPSLAATRLAAARYIREEICGPMEQKVQHSGDAGLTLRIVTKQKGEDG